MQNVSSFESLKLSEKILDALASLHFERPTPIQAQAIPVALEGRDIIGCAQTGTGKTAAFCVPILSHLIENPKSCALVLVPTRELAIQINTFWTRLNLHSYRLPSALVIGGASMQSQCRALSKFPRFIVATPGRLVDHLKRRTARLNQLKHLVLDEADRMLDMGFAPQLNQILRQLPPQRQTLLFSATWAPELDQITRNFQKDPKKITVGKVSAAAPMVTQRLVMTTVQKKNDALLDELNNNQGSALVFARTQSRTDRVARFLETYGINVARLHGGRSQGQRNLALTGFRAGKVRVLVATDIASRGIDVTEIGNVINYDLPQQSEDYIHRIGRTGRAGKAGQAVSLLTPEDRGQWKFIARLLEKSGSSVPQMPNLDKSQARPHAKPQGKPEKSPVKPLERGHDRRQDRRQDRHQDRARSHRADSRPLPRPLPTPNHPSQ